MQLNFGFHGNKMKSIEVIRSRPRRGLTGPIRIPPRTVSSNGKGHTKSHSLYDDSDAERQNWCQASPKLGTLYATALYDV